MEEQRVHYEQQTTHRDLAAELEKLRAVQEEKEKWEKREERLLLREKPASSLKAPPTVGVEHAREIETSDTSVVPKAAERLLRPTAPSFSPYEHSPREPIPSRDVTPSESLTRCKPSELPPIPNFTGTERADGETPDFQDWWEQFELVADACQWNERTKLVQLTMRLRGTAYSFYRSCPSTKKSSYHTLAEELKKRFTPIRIPAVQTNLFHERKQAPKESVDSYAQDLRQLFFKAYPDSTRGSEEAEEMGQRVLACQFVAGLHPDIKEKLVGVDGSFDSLLIKARFEEAKQKELPDLTASKPRSSILAPSLSNPPERSNSHSGRSSQRQFTKTAGECYNCGMKGHLARECRYRGRAAPNESQPSGKRREPTKSGSQVAAINTSEGNPTLKVQSLQHELKVAQLEQALDRTKGTLHNVTPESSDDNRKLGPIITANVQLEGMNVTALLDTGSPVSIVSLDKFLMACAQARPQGQSPDEWEAEIRSKLHPSTVTLRNYGGGEISIVGEVNATIVHGSHEIEAPLQVQPEASVDLLLGTDLMPSLGFTLMSIESGTVGKDLFRGCQSIKLEPATSSEQEDPTKVVAPPEDTTPPSTPITVRLITPVRIPPRHSQLVKAEMCGPQDIPVGKDMLLEPNLSFVNSSGIQVDPAMITRDPDNCIVLAIHNLEHNTVKVQPGETLGQLSEVHEIKDPDSDYITLAAVHTANSEAIRPTEERFEDIWRTVRNNGPHLSTEQQSQLQPLIRKYEGLFAINPSELGCTNVVKHSIDTGTNLPIKQPVRRVPFALRDTISTMVNDMIQQGVVKPSRSPWASPVVLVRKKDGTMRFCVDYRKLNTITKKDVYPLPRIDDALDQLSAMKYFSTLDLASGYWQVKMGEESREKTAFTTPGRLFEFIVMPFGLCNAPATFQRLMESILEGLIGKACMVYLDDILVFGQTLDEHLENLVKVFERLKKAGLRLKPKKCHFLQPQVEYLGYVVSAEGVSADPKKVQAIWEYAIPGNVKSLKTFLGLASYYRRFIPNFARIAHPLHSLTRKEASYVWDAHCQEAFDCLKQHLTNSPVLAFPNFREEFILETDASLQGLGAVLSQEQPDGNQRPISYGSRSLQPHEQNYGITELEALGVVWAVKHFRPYIYGHHCRVITDHQALKSLLNTPQPSGKLARWGMAIQELDLTIQYRPGTKNQKADALSRFPLEVKTDGPLSERCSDVVVGVTRPSETSHDSTLGSQQKDDPTLKPIIQFLEDGTLPEDVNEARKLVASQSQFSLIDDVLYHTEPDGTLRIIPPSNRRKELWRQLHSGKCGGHLKDAKMYGQLKRHYWWPKMRRDVTDWCRGCLTCATRNVGRHIQVPLTPIPVGGPFDRVGVDVIKYPKSSKGNQYAVVFVDYLTKWPE